MEILGTYVLLDITPILIALLVYYFNFSQLQCWYFTPHSLLAKKHDNFSREHGAAVLVGHTATEDAEVRRSRGVQIPVG